LIAPRERIVDKPMRPGTGKRIARIPLLSFVGAGKALEKGLTVVEEEHLQERMNYTRWKLREHHTEFLTGGLGPGSGTAFGLRFFDDNFFHPAVRAELPLWISTRNYQQFDTPAAEYLAQVLIARREMTGRYWFRKAGALDNFRVGEGDGGGTALSFDDLAVARNFAEPAERTYRWRVVRGKCAGPWQQSSAALPQIPLAADDQAIELQIRNAGESHWSPAVSVHLKVASGGLHLAGWVREVN
jgi:hypothetical protein